MIRRLLNLNAAAVATITGSLLVTGCATDGTGDQPYELTGQPSQANQARWSDEKGHYRPDWAAGVNRPPGYPLDEPERQP